MANRVDALGGEVTREASTVELYGRRVATLRKRATSEMGCPAGLYDTIESFSLAHLEYKETTIRQYSSALALAVDAEEESGELDATQAAACRERLTHRPMPRPPGAEKRTSAKKRKAVSSRELHAVCEKLHRRARGEDSLLLALLVQNVSFGLRPCEYHGADVGEVYLVVQSAKTTNGRALSATREFELDGLRGGQIESLRTLIATMELAAKGNVPALIDRLGGRLRRVCSSLGIEPFSLYTTRHQAIANKKATGSAEDVAAFAGHASVHTARKFYAPRGAAWKIGKTANPSPAMVKMVEARRAPAKAPKQKF